MSCDGFNILKAIKSRPYMHDGEDVVIWRSRYNHDWYDWYDVPRRWVRKDAPPNPPNRRNDYGINDWFNRRNINYLPPPPGFKPIRPPPGLDAPGLELWQ